MANLRRSRLDLNTAEERAISELVDKIEELGAHEKLTDAVTLMLDAKDALSDYIDEQLKEEK